MIYPIQLISMVLFATDKENEVSACDADAQTTYFCLDCGRPLRLRKAKRKFPHFYHIATSPHCRLYSKSERHLLIQLDIQKKLPIGKAVLEKQFRNIKRIADVAWEEKKIVFEIQCSPISDEEVKERIESYRSIGYEIIWILDERKFNKYRMSKAEELIRKQCGYFVGNSNHPIKPFLFYDQLEIFHNQRRLKKGEKTILNLATINLIPKNLSLPSAPKQVKERFARAKYYLSQDIFEKIITSDFQEVLRQWALLEKSLYKRDTKKEFFQKIFRKYIKNPYIRALQSLLKRS
jgi:competence protein CoiA